jgi:SAM-dependent methyltransferase
MTDSARAGNGAGTLFPALDAWDPAPLRRALERGGYTQATLRQLQLADTPFQSRASALFREALPAGSPLRALARLFLLGDAVPASDLLEPLGLELATLADLGLLRPVDGAFRATVSLVPYADSWFASDFLRRHSESPADYVMGLSPVSRMLGALTPRQHGTTALELGCGAGWLGLQLRRAGMQVTGTDICPRALELARFNQRLAGSGAIEWRQGHWFEPVAGRRFDLIVCNPPFVQSPGGPLTFRETAPGSKPACEDISGGLREHLEPGGLACVLLNWCQHRNDSAPAPLAWTPSEGLRRWLFVSESLRPAEYAWRWIRPDPRFHDEASSKAELERWVAHHMAAGTRAVLSGFLVVQRCAPGEEWTRSDSRTLGELPSHAGEEVLRVLRNESWLRQGAEDAILLDRRYMVPDGIRAEISTGLIDAGWGERTIRLTSPGRLSYEGEVDENLLRLLELCRKGLRPADMVAELRARPQFATVEGLATQIAGLTRELVRHGLLEP